MTRIGGGRANADNQWRQGGGGVWNFANLADVTCEQHLDLARLKAESGGLVFENPFAQKVPKVKQGHSKTKRPQRWNWKVNFWPRLNSPLLAINLGPAFKNSQSCSSQHCHNKRWKNHEEWRSQLCSSSSWLFSTSLRLAAMKMVVASVHLKLERWSLQRRARIGKIATMKKVSFVAADGTSDKNFGTASAQKLVSSTTWLRDKSMTRMTFTTHENNTNL